MKPFSNDQIDVDSLPQAGNLIVQPLERKYRTILLISKTIFVGVLLLGCLGLVTTLGPRMLGSILATESGGIGILVLIILLLFIPFSYLSTIKGFENKGYALRQKDILYKSGWLWKQTTTVPFNRIQHVSIDQGPIERNYNLAKLRVFTAGGSGSDLTIPGLTLETATELKEFIVKKTESDEEQ